MNDRNTKLAVYWCLALTVVNVLLSAYTADFVHQIEQFMHSL